MMRSAPQYSHNFVTVASNTTLITHPIKVSYRIIVSVSIISIMSSSMLKSWLNLKQPSSNGLSSTNPLSTNPLSTNPADPQYNQRLCREAVAGISAGISKGKIAVSDDEGSRVIQHENGVKVLVVVSAHSLCVPAFSLISIHRYTYFILQASMNNPKSALNFLSLYYEGWSLAMRETFGSRPPLGQTGSCFVFRRLNSPSGPAWVCGVDRRVNETKHYPRQDYQPEKVSHIPVVCLSDVTLSCLEGYGQKKARSLDIGTNIRIDGQTGKSTIGRGSEQEPCSVKRPGCLYINPSKHSTAPAHIDSVKLHKRDAIVPAKRRPKSDWNESSKR